MTPLRVGVVGVGHLGQHHARILAAHPGRRAGRRRRRPARAGAGGRRAARHHAPSPTTASCSTRSTPSRSPSRPSSTARSPAAFLERGHRRRWSRSRWPRSLAEAEELVALARRRGRVLQVGHIERFNPALSALDGLPLRPKYIAAERLSTYTFRSTDIGVVLDLMIHDIDLVLSLVAGARSARSRPWA